MNCREARAQLATYRRDDWTSDELNSLREHLATCASCRQVEAAFRHVGESIRHLPTITPDSTFKDRVFAAIAADQRHAGPAAMRASRAITEPSLPVVRAPVVAASRRQPGPLLMVALAAAAVLVVSLVSMQWLSARNAANIAANISRQNAVTQQERVSSYLPDQRFFQVSALNATRDWVGYVAGDGAGSSMLFVVDRHSGASHELFATPTTGAVTLVSLSSHWVVWSVSSATGWNVSAAALTGPSAWKAQALDQSVTSTLTGVWANDSEALIATSTSGEASLSQLAIANSATSAIVVATGSHRGAIIASPSLAGNTVYWADVWADTQGALHSAIWSESGAGASPVTQAGGEAYTPTALNGALLWINATNSLSVATTPGASDIAAAASKAAGKLTVMTLASGALKTLSASTAAATVRASGSTVLWSDSSSVQTYDLSASHASAAALLIAHAEITGADADALAWFDGSHIVVYAL